MISASNIYLHPRVCTPESVQAVMESTGLVPTQSNREKNKIILITPFAAAVKEACKGVCFDHNGDSAA